MATKRNGKTTDVTVVEQKGRAVSSWENEMAEEAARFAKQEENVGGGSFFSIKSGVLSWQGNQLPDNQMAVVILDGIMENTYYDADFDSDSPRSPICYAFGRDEKEMKPHEKVFEEGTEQHDRCETCQWNAWGSAEKGKGKACKNVRRLALMGMGTFGRDGQFVLQEDLDVVNSPVGYMRLPVMSVKGYAAYVKQLAGALRRPPYGVITKIKLVPDPKSQFRVTFEAIEPVPDDLMGEIFNRSKAIREEIMFPYRSNTDEEGEEETGRAAVKAPVKRAPSKAARGPQTPRRVGSSRY